MLTLADARTLLSQYAGVGNDFVTRLNLVCERLIKSGSWSGTKQRVTFAVYPDANNRAFITLPRTLNTILAGAYQPSTVCNGGYPMEVRNGWYEFSIAGAGLQLDSRYDIDRGFIPQEGRFTTFADWSTAMRLRLKFSASETAGTIYVRGFYNGAKIFTSIEGLGVAFSGNTTVTTTQKFDKPPYAFIKPVTTGTVSLYTVDDSNAETLVAVYEPGETDIGWRRYLVPACTSWTADAPGYFVGVCKRAYVQLRDDRDEVIPSNIGAIRHGMDGLAKEDAEDFVRGNQLWELAKGLLANEVNDDDGAGAQGCLQVADDFEVSAIGGYLP